MLETLNSILMLDHQSKSSIITEEQRKSIIKAKLSKLERLQQMITIDIQESNNRLRYTPKLEELNEVI